MARAHLKLTVQPAVKAELEKRFKTTEDVRQRQRLQAVLLATTGQHGYRDIAQIVGCATRTFALWLNSSLARGANPRCKSNWRKDSKPGAGARPPKWRPGCRRSTGSSGPPNRFIAGWE